MQFFSQWKNVILVVVSISLMAGITLPIISSVEPMQIFSIKKAQAQWTTLGDVQRWIQYALDKVQTFWKNYLYPALRDLAAKRLMDYITQQTLNWINNGTTPTFVGNWNQLIKDAGNIAFDSVNDYLKNNGVDLCSPFVPQIQLLLQGTRFQPQPVRCSIDNFLTNISNSTDMLKRGDWLTYSQVIMPENNPMGLYLISENRIYSEYLNQQTARVNEAVASSGFLGQKTCSDADAQQAAEGVCASQNLSDTDYKSCVNNILKSTCKSWDIKTPGDVAGKAVANAITSDTQWSANIQNFVSVVINALINKVFQRGLSNLGHGSGTSETSDITIVNDTSTVSQLQDTKNQIATYYEDVGYYLNSSDYPALQTWKDVQSLAQEGIASCTPSDDWTTEYNNVTAVVNGLQAMVDEAQTNLDELNAIDPSTLTTDQLSQQIQDAMTKFNSFHTTYQAIIDGDVEKTKQTGANMTDTQTAATKEENLLTTDLSTAPACTSPLTSHQ
jgi:hypothetical protein